MIDKRSLERKTRRYWGDYNHDHPEPCLEWYIEELLPEEMQYAQVQDKTCGLLVLLVGFSIEPLLQAVHAYKPRKVLLILNERYGRDRPGPNWGQMVKRLIAKLPESPEIVETAVLQAGPQQVFQALLEHVCQTEGAIVDITGAKKNMVAGAFLFAALANVPVSYVDFDNDAYDPERAKPYGYGCDIGTLDNPYEKFALRDWERVRHLYHRHTFRDARRLLVGEDGNGESGTVLVTMTEYLPDSEPAIRTLAEVLRCYELWDAGLYNEAAEQARTIDGFQPPTAVQRLGGKWFEIGQARFEGGLANFYEDTLEFQAYVYDELARIDRLIEFNHDYRSAFLRAGSLNEVVILARLVELADDDPQREALLAALQHRTPSAYSVFDNLRRSVGHSFQIGPEGNDEAYYEICFQNAPEITVEITERMDWWRDIPLFDNQGSWKQFINRRNDLAHKYYSPPREWAEDALNFVRANVEDFWGADADKGVDTQALPWSELCKLTGLKQFLTPNLWADVSD